MNTDGCSWCDGAGDSTVGVKGTCKCVSTTTLKLGSERGESESYLEGDEESPLYRRGGL